MVVQCNPWSIDCSDDATTRLVAMCCGKEIDLCSFHAIFALEEIAKPEMYCLVCGQTYEPSTWTEWSLV